MTFSLNEFVERIASKGLNVLSVRVLQHGRLIDEWDADQDVRRQQHSISKSFTCMAAILAITEGKLHLGTKLQDLFPQYAGLAPESPLPPEKLTLFDLLRMSSGHDSPPLWAEERASLQEKDWVKYYMSLPLDRFPGETFTYSSGDTFIVSAMIQAAVGQTVKDYLTPRLFEPLGIQNVQWDASPLGITLGCAGLWISNEELSRFGQLMLQKGNWQGTQLIPEEWIELVTRKHTDTTGGGDWSEGYGCQFWMCTHEAYRADGAHGQFCVILPRKEAVIAVNSEEDNLQAIMDTIWADIYPQL